MANGDLILITRRWDSSDPELPIFNAETDGLRSGEVVTFRSNDERETWSPPEVLELPGAVQADTPSQIIELRNGRWLLACELWKAWADPTPLHLKGFVVFSDDEGKTWKDRINLRSADDPRKMFSHSRYTQMLDGRVAALQWTQEMGTGKDFNLNFTISDESGNEWTYPVPTDLQAQTSWLADLGGRTLAAVYMRRGGERNG
jgi:hypothetical protein